MVKHPQSADAWDYWRVFWKEERDAAMAQAEQSFAAGYDSGLSIGRQELAAYREWLVTRDPGPSAWEMICG